MEPECSLPHSQEPAICPYSEPDQSTPWLPIPLPEDQFYYYHPIYAWVFQHAEANSCFSAKAPEVKLKCVVWDDAAG